MNIITRASVKERIHVEQIIRSQPRMHNSGLVDIVTIPVRKCLGLSMDVLSVPRERFLDIASKLDSLAFDDDPYEYHNNEGVESISDIADNLLNPTYRKAIIKALQDKQEYYAEDEFDDANIAERAKDILDNLAEIFGSDEQED